jgi:uncharacterized membrane protein
MKPILRFGIILPMLLFPLHGYCCVNCNTETQQAIATSFQEYPAVLSGFLIVGILVVILSFIALRKDSYRSKSGGLLNSPKVPVTASAIVLGIGIGGFIDGVLLHQVLQWHEMLSNKIPPATVVTKSVNMFWDGLFHLFMLIVTITGVFLLWTVHLRKRIYTTTGLLTGGMMTGWGLFNLLEGLLNHHILSLHNVRESTPDQELWNYGFLIFSIFLIIAGVGLVKRAPYSHSTY